MTLIPFLRELPAFERFTDEELEAFVLASSLFEFPEGYLFSDENDPGEATYLLVKGRVRVFQHDKPIKSTISVTEVCAGEMFNILSLVEDLPIPTTAVALEPTIALKFSRDSLTAVKSSCPRIAHQFQYMVAIQLANALYARNTELRSRL